MDIVEKLRGGEVVMTIDGYAQISRLGGSVLNEAADEIERLNKRIETLQEVVRNQHEYGVEQLKENDRLRELLQNWMGCCFVDFVKEDVSFGMGVKKIWAETRAFLKQQDNPQ